MHEDAPLLDQLVAQRGQAVGLDKQHEALGLPLAGLVRRELFVLVAAVAARLVAVEDCCCMFSIDLRGRGACGW